LLLSAVACVQNDGTRFNPIEAYTDVSIEQEREMGAEFDRLIRDHILLIDDPVVLGFVNDLGYTIVRKIEPQPFIYHFRVIVDPTLNAFAVPGGYIYLHSGTILQSGSLHELAGVVAHEIGHVKGRHYARMREKAAIPDPRPRPTRSAPTSWRAPAISRREWPTSSSASSSRAATSATRSLPICTAIPMSRTASPA
jgi:predicted Zn-dependent protease